MTWKRLQVGSSCNSRFTCCIPLSIDIFDRALAMKIVQKDTNQLVPLILARAGYERRQLDESNEGTLLFSSSEPFTRFHRRGCITYID